jgi:hypothetical protein
MYEIVDPPAREKRGCGWHIRNGLRSVMTTVLVIVVVVAVWSFFNRASVPSVARALGRVGNVQAAAARIDYKELARNTERYVGQEVYYEGRIMQVVEERSIYVMRVSVTDDFDTVLVICNCFRRPLEDDNVALVGKVDGRQSYKSILGETITLPKLTATAFEIVE